MRGGDQGSPPHSKRSGGGGGREGSRHGGGGGGALEVKPANMKVGGGGGSATRGSRSGSSKEKYANLYSMEEEGSHGQQGGEGGRPHGSADPGSVSASMEEGLMEGDSRSRGEEDMLIHGNARGGGPLGSNGTVAQCEEADNLADKAENNGTVTMALDSIADIHSRAGDVRETNCAIGEMELDSHSVMDRLAACDRAAGHSGCATAAMEAEAKCRIAGSGNVGESSTVEGDNREGLNQLAETSPITRLTANSGIQQLPRQTGTNGNACIRLVAQQAEAPDQSNLNGNSISNSIPGSIARLAAITGMPMQSSLIGACSSRVFGQGTSDSFGSPDPSIPLANIDCMDNSMCLGMNDQQVHHASLPHFLEGAETDAPSTDSFSSGRRTQTVCRNAAERFSSEFGQNASKFDIHMQEGVSLSTAPPQVNSEQPHIANSKDRSSNGYQPSRFSVHGQHMASSARSPNQGAATIPNEVRRQGTTTNNAWKRPVVVPLAKYKFEEVQDKDGVGVTLDNHSMHNNIKRLEAALVGKLLGKKLPFYYLNIDLRRKWSQWGNFELVLVGPDCFLCIFQSVEARDAVLSNGPWFIAGNVIAMDKWTPTFSPDSLTGLTTPLWMRLPGLPLIYWDDNNLARIASFVGEPLWMDNQTSKWGQSTYARICVKIDLSKRLPPGIWINGYKGRFFQKVEYEGIAQLCFRCGKVGHKLESCPDGAKTDKTIPPNSKPNNSPNPTQQQPTFVTNQVQNFSKATAYSSDTNSGAQPIGTFSNMQQDCSSLVNNPGANSSNKTTSDSKGKEHMANADFSNIANAGFSNMQNSCSSSASIPATEFCTISATQAGGNGSPSAATAHQEAETLYGPWTLVQRRKNRTPNAENQNKGTKGNTAKQKTATAQNQKIQADGKGSTHSNNSEKAGGRYSMQSTHDKGEGESSAPHIPKVFSAAKAMETDTTLFKHHNTKTGQSRVSKAHFQRELGQLGPIKAVPRKRKKSEFHIDEGEAPSRNVHP